MKPIGVAPGARRNAAALALGAILLLATACGPGGGSNAGSGDDGKPGGGSTSTSDTVASTAVVNIAPKDGAGDVATTGTLKVSASGGKLESVTVKDDKGSTVPGDISSDGLGWTPSDHLSTSTEYTVDAVAKDAAGRESDKHSTFTTVTPKDTFVGFFTPEDGSTVGVGMEVYLNFNRPITNKKAVEQGVTVTASPSVPVAAHWYGDQQLYIRPADYWAALHQGHARPEPERCRGRPRRLRQAAQAGALHDRPPPGEHRGRGQAHDDRLPGQQGAAHDPDLLGRAGTHHVQRQDGDLREVPHHPDER